MSLEQGASDESEDSPVLPAPDSWGSDVGKRGKDSAMSKITKAKSGAWYEIDGGVARLVAEPGSPEERLLEDLAAIDRLLAPSWDEE